MPVVKYDVNCTACGKSSSTSHPESISTFKCMACRKQKVDWRELWPKGMEEY